MDYRRHLHVLAFITAILLSESAIAQGEHPIDVQREAAAGDYMAALVSYDKMPKRITTTQSRVAAAKSAWALSLPDRALAEYDAAIRQGGLDTIELARIYLGKAIIERQEERYELAILQAQKAFTLLTDPSPLRAQVLALWGESLAAQKAFAPAEDKYSEALQEADSESKVELSFLIGTTQFDLGKYDLARANLQKIPLRHDRAPQAIRLLGQIALQQDDFENAAFWLGKGRAEYPDSFLDSWTDYVLLRGAIAKKDTEAVRNVRAQAEKRYPASDPWLALLTATAEEFEWRSGGVRR